MISADRLPALRRIVQDDQCPVSGAAADMARAIRARHGPCISALIFYGSAMRQGAGDGKMYDFYVIVDRYRSVYGSGFKALAGFLLPPGVHYLETEGPNGTRLRSKYSIMSERAFHRRVRGAAFESMLWARFAQPAIILADDRAVQDRLLDTLALATARLADEVRALLRPGYGPLDPWVRALSESYRTELRPERHHDRAVEIVTRFDRRYRRLSEVLFPDPACDVGGIARLSCRCRWFLRRLVGKPAGALRILKGATTFDAGLDYILEKVASHSGVTIEVSEAERRRPVLHAPQLAWRLFRAGAFR